MRQYCNYYINCNIFAKYKIRLYDYDMKIAFVGKGGSGKTTAAALFARYMQQNGHRVLALDSDINQHFAPALGYEDMMPSMGMQFDQIKRHLRGDNTRFTVDEMKKTTPPGNGSHFVTLGEDDWFMKHFTRNADGIRVAGAGEIPEGNVGVRCYHGLNGAVELVLGHMIDADDDVVVVDMTAGADAFSSTLFAKVDALVLVVEPTQKSLSVYGQFMPNIEKYSLPFFVVGNKIIDQADIDFISETIPKLAAVVPQSSYVRARERGQAIDMEAELLEQLKILSVKIMSTPRNWDRMQQRSHELHQKNADSWAGEQAKSHIDPEFSLAAHAKTLLNS